MTAKESFTMFSAVCNLSSGDQILRSRAVMIASYESLDDCSLTPARRLRNGPFVELTRVIGSK